MYRDLRLVQFDDTNRIIPLVSTITLSGFYCISKYHGHKSF